MIVVVLQDLRVRINVYEALYPLLTVPLTVMGYVPMLADVAVVQSNTFVVDVYAMNVGSAAPLCKVALYVYTTSAHTAGSDIVKLTAELVVGFAEPISKVISENGEGPKVTALTIGHQERSSITDIDMRFLATNKVSKASVFVPSLE